MKILKSLTRIAGKALVLSLIFALLKINPSSSFLNDIEVSEGNSLSASVLDLTVRSGQQNFVSGSVDVANMKPGESVARDIYVGKTQPSLALKHKLSYQYVSGNQALCSQLQLKVWYDHYHCDPALGYTACRDMRLTYNGSLSALADFTDTDFLIPHPDDQFDVDPSDGTEQWFYYQITLPSGLGEEYQDKTCQFNFVYQGYQIESDASWGFVDEEILGGNNIGTGDWTPPSVPTGMRILDHNGTDLGCSRATNNRSITVDWNDNPETDLAYYQYDIKDKDDHARPTESEYSGNIRDEDGEYKYRVRAVDKDGNKSDPTDWCYVTLDRSTPITSFYTSNSPLREIKQDVLNSDFDNGTDGLENWTTAGNVAVVGSESFDTDGDLIDDLTIDPNDIPNSSPNPHMVVIRPSNNLSGVDSNDGDELYYSLLSQEIPNSAKTLSFWYNFLTKDSTGFDNPGFSVYLNDKEIYQMWAEDINLIQGDLSSSGWQKFYYNLSAIDMGENPILTLVFYAGNKGDNDSDFDSWVYLDKISTNDVIVNAKTKLYLPSTDSLSPKHTYFKLGACDSIPDEEKQEYSEIIYPDGFQLTEATADNKFCYWTEDEAGNKEENKEIILIFDNEAPEAIYDLEVADLGNGEFALDWTAVDPNDAITGNTTAAQYLVKYSTFPIENDADFDSADSTQSASPRPAGENETLSIKGLTPNATYYFAVKAIDAAGNQSDLDSGSGSIATNGSLVVLNEIMYNPAGSDSASKPDGEWVELYNNADYDIDVDGWAIKDDDGHTVVISTSNSDNDGDPDTGETIVPENGWLVVYLQSAMLNNGGDFVGLYNSVNQLIDSHTYAGGKAEGTSEARNPDGVGAWVDPIPTPGRKNVLSQNQLEPQIKIYQQDDNNVKIGIFDAINYQSISCDIYYSHQEEGMEEFIQENIKKTAAIDDLETFVKNIYLGTESKGIYTPHHNISDVKLNCVLSGEKIPDRSLEADLEGSWKQE